MIDLRQIPMNAVAVVGLAGLLVLGGCSKRSLVVTASSAEAPKAVAEAKPAVPAVPAVPERVQPREPLKGFEKAPAEEVVKPPAPMEVAKAQPQEIVPGKVQEAAKRELLAIYFAFDRWSLSSEGKKNLAQSAEVLKQNPAAKLLIEGHCDERGSREYNLVLGEKRAQEARRYLQVLGVTNPVNVTSVGKERPVCTEQDESCYWKNRRAHLAVLEK